MTAPRLTFDRAGDDELAGELHLPPGGKGPVLVLLQEIFGVNDALRDAARRFAAEGFCVVLPDLFWRLRPGIELGYTEAEVDVALGYKRRLDVARAVADVATVVAAMRLHPAGDGRVAVAGFCMGGTLAWLTAARHELDACVAFYGGGIEQHLDERPACPVLLHFGARDELIPPPAVAAVRAALADRADASVVVHPEAGHGFFFPARANWNEPAARSALATTLTMLRARLGAPALPAHLRELRIDVGPAQDASARVLALDTLMRARYDEVLRAVGRAQSPVILTAFNETGGAFTLLHEGREETVRPVPPRYAHLKSVSHMPLAIYSVLAPHFGEPRASDRWRSPLGEVADRLRSAHDALPRLGLPEADEGRCRRVLAAALAFCTDSLRDGGFTVESYRAFARSVREDVERNIHEAAALQVRSFLPVLKRWQGEVGEEAWSRLYALVSTAWAMRRYNVHQQILASVMGEAAIDRRLFLAEGVEGRDALLDLLGRIVLDRGVSGLFFDDVHLLDRELMGPATACALARERA